MSDIENEIARLQENHDKMEAAIAERQGDPNLTFMIVDLKKKKLKLKEQIEELKKQIQ